MAGSDAFLPPHHSQFDDGAGGAAVSAARDEDLAAYPENWARLQEVCRYMGGFGEVCGWGGTGTLFVYM